MTKELRSIPFDVGYRLYMDAADIAEATLEAENQERYQEYIEKLEQEYSDTHEAPYEGNFSDKHPYQKHPKANAYREKAGQAALVKEFIPRYKLDSIMQTWVMPQIIAWLTHKPIQLEEVSSVEGKIDGRKIAPAIFDFSSEWDLGLYQFLMLDSRSSYLASQYKGEGRTYCSLVPLIPYAWKLNHNIKYSQWDTKGLRYVVNDSLYRAMTCEIPEDLTREDILAARTQGLTFKTGTKAGTVRNPVSTYRLYDTTGTKLHGLPELAQTMLAQIWCAHPSNRTKYMVLDPKSWDSIPTPLISDDIFKTPKSPGFVMPKSDNSDFDLPWLR